MIRLSTAEWGCPLYPTIFKAKQWLSENLLTDKYPLSSHPGLISPEKDFNSRRL